MLSEPSGLFTPLRLAAGWVGWTCPTFVMLDNVQGTRFWESPNVGHSVRMIVLQVVLGAVMARFVTKPVRLGVSEPESLRA